jgi:hypothetical protein
MVAGLAELLSTPAWEFTTFPNAEGQHELVLARNVPFTSVCAHHLLPFSGVAQVGVLPGERIAGLSKLARAVEAFAARMQVQEELGQQVASFLEGHLVCRGVGVVLEAEHLCMTRRGIKHDPPLALGAPAQIDRLITFGGGIPITADGHLIGGIGVCGGHWSDDIKIAQAGLAAIVPRHDKESAPPLPSTRRTTALA